MLSQWRGGGKGRLANGSWATRIHDFKWVKLRVRYSEAVPLLRKVFGIAWKVTSIACVLYACWIAIGTFVLSQICDQAGAYSLVTSDADNSREVKATVFTTDCGAMTSKRTIVKFSNAFVDGRTLGDTVLVLTGVDCGSVQAKWTTNRDFVVSYPNTASVEFSVAKIRGVTIELEPR
jgi:hypothetical protein